jgi:hypothetical protein
MSPHTAKAFDIDLQELTRKVAEMGGLAEREIADAVQALSRRDDELARKVIATDATIDALQLEIEEKAILTIARRQPMAVDLREIVGALRVANDLERIGDLAKNIGKRVLALTGEFPSQKVIRGRSTGHSHNGTSGSRTGRSRVPRLLHAHASARRTRPLAAHRTWAVIASSTITWPDS